MHPRASSGAFLAGLVLVACGSPDAPERISSTRPAPEATGPWVGSVVTDGNVTTVINESGSVWNRGARLVEEASIGVEAGDARYMFGMIGSIWATDELIYVLDRQIPALRVYDHDGHWVRNIGRPGQGPGEFLRLSDVLVTSDGRVLVYSPRTGRVNVFSDAGEPLEIWNLGAIGQNPALDIDDRVWMWVSVPGEDRASHDDDHQGRQEVDRGGRVEPLQLGPYRPRETRIPSIGPPEFWVGDPYAVTPTTTFDPRRAFISGRRDAYEIRIDFFDGRVMQISRNHVPVPLSPEWAEYRKHRIEAMVRQRVPGWTWAVNPPDHKRPFESIVATRDGRFLVFREGRSRPLPDCTADIDEPHGTCWDIHYFWDVFDPDGRYLGRVDSPVGWVADPFVRGDLWLMRTVDEAGTPMVKRYRLVAPTTQ